MRKTFRVTGWIFLLVGLFLCSLGVLSLPDGGLMFALPYFFLIPGLALTVGGGLALLLTRSKQGAVGTTAAEIESKNGEQGGKAGR